MKKFLCLLLACAMIVALCGCTSKKDLIGTWEAKEYSTSDEIRTDLEYLDFYNDEISYANFDTYYFVRTVEFTEDTFTDTYDKDASVAAIKAYLIDFFGRLYENRTNIESYEGYFDDIASAEDFLACYADVFFGYEDCDEMLQDMAADIYDSYDIPYDSREYKLDMFNDWIEVDREQVGNTTNITKIGLELKGDSLTLEFLEDTVTYTKR